MYGNYGNEDRGFRPRRSFAPVKEGDELDVKIEAVGEKGDGVAKVKGFVLFVPGTKEGETVKVRVKKVLKKVGFAEKIGEGVVSEEPAAGEEEPKPAKKKKSEEFSEEPVEEEFKTQEDTEDFGEDSE